MKNLNFALVRLIQFVVFVLFTTIVLTYFGALVLLPLDAVVLIGKVLAVIGLGQLLGTLLAIPAVAYCGLVIYKTPGLVQMLIDTGMDLVNAGKQRVESFNALAESVK